MTEFRPARGALLFVGGVALGGAAIALESGGVQQRPSFGMALLVASIILGFAPLRLALPIAIVVGSYQGLIDNFVGSAGRYWKEAFVAILVARALRARLPTPAELSAFLFGMTAFVAYSLTGAGASEVAWGLKLLVLYLIAGWAIAVLVRDANPWSGVLDALAVVAVSSVILAYWQHRQGTQGMLALGFPYGGSVREAAGRLRAFAGFDYSAPFSYALAIAFLAWFGALLSGRRRRALGTIWVPVCALLGIYLSLDRIALVGVVAGVIAGLTWTRKVQLAVPLAGVAVLSVVLFANTTGGSFLAQGFTFGSNSAQARQQIWQQRWDGVTALGHGPASAGAALARVNPTSANPSSGVVDNQYLSWLYEYGFLGGGVVCGAFVLLLLSPLWAWRDRAVPPDVRLTAALVGVFFTVAAISVNVWEEFPLNFVAAVVFGIFLGCVSAGRCASGEPSRVSLAQRARPRSSWPATHPASVFPDAKSG